MVNKLYSEFSGICHDFCRMYFPHEKIANIVDKYLKENNCQEILFVGALLDTVKILQNKGYDITFVDYTEEMVEEAKEILDGVSFFVSDIRNINFDKEFDAIVAVGRILTYMHTDEDVVKALNAFFSNLKDGGVVIMDNYEEGRIDKGNYFNGAFELKGECFNMKRMEKILFCTAGTVSMRKQKTEKRKGLRTVTIFSGRFPEKR